MALERCNPWDESQSNTCPLAEACARDEIGTLMGRAAIANSPCWTFEKGMNCGLATSYFEAALLTLDLKRLDEVSPITHFSRVVETPDGIAPLEVRKAIRDITFHVRKNLQPTDTTDQVVSIHPTDFVLKLHNLGKFREANWYQRYVVEQAANGKEVTSWQFHASEMNTWENLIDRPTAQEYGGQAWTMKGLLMWAGYVLPPELFTPSSKDGKEFFGVLQGFADEMHDGDLQATLADYIGDKFENGSFHSIVLRRQSNTKTVDSEGSVVEIYQNGAVIYDRDRGIDFRDNPGDAPVPELPFNEKVKSSLQSRRASVRDL